MALSTRKGADGYNNLPSRCHFVVTIPINTVVKGYLVSAGVRPAAAAGRVKVMDAAASVRRHRAAMRRL